VADPSQPTRAERGDLNLALGCAVLIALLVVVGLTISLWTL
jgi:hypothetical protein